MLFYSCSSRQPDTPVLADMDHRVVESPGTDLVERSGHLHRGTELEAVDADVGNVERLERAGITALGRTNPPLAVVEPPERPDDALIGVLDERLRAGTDWQA